MSTPLDCGRTGATRLAALAMLAAGLAVILAACTETSLNEAPIVDRSSHPHATVQPAQTDADAATLGTTLVRQGDTLYAIASKFHCTVKDLAQWNGLQENAPIVVGQRLRVRAPEAAAAAPAPVVAAAPPEEPPVEASATPIKIDNVVETRALETSPLPATSAAPGVVPTPMAPIAAPAPSAAPDTVPAATASPAAPPPTEAVPPAPAAAPAPATAWVWPVGGKVVSGFAPPTSKGIEIAAAEDESIIAVADGVVTYTGSALGDYGNLVILRHPDGLLSVYAHAKSILVQLDQKVIRGQALAVAGRTTGKVPSVHFEVRRKGVPTDPMEFLPAR